MASERPSVIPNGRWDNACAQFAECGLLDDILLSNDLIPRQSAIDAAISDLCLRCNYEAVLGETLDGDQH